MPKVLLLNSKSAHPEGNLIQTVFSFRIDVESFTVGKIQLADDMVFIKAFLFAPNPWLGIVSVIVVFIIGQVNMRSGTFRCPPGTK